VYSHVVVVEWFGLVESIVMQNNPANEWFIELQYSAAQCSEA